MGITTNEKDSYNEWSVVRKVSPGMRLEEFFSDAVAAAAAVVAACADK